MFDFDKIPSFFNKKPEKPELDFHKRDFSKFGKDEPEEKSVIDLAEKEDGKKFVIREHNVSKILDTLKQEIENNYPFTVDGIYKRLETIESMIENNSQAQWEIVEKEKLVRTNKDNQRLEQLTQELGHLNDARARLRNLLPTRPTDN